MTENEAMAWLHSQAELMKKYGKMNIFDTLERLSKAEADVERLSKERNEYYNEMNTAHAAELSTRVALMEEKRSREDERKRIANEIRTAIELSVLDDEDTKRLLHLAEDIERGDFSKGEK